MKKRACTSCKIFVDQELCPNCKTSSFSTIWKGRIFVVDPEKSKIAKKVGHNQTGEYAIKI